MNDETIDTVAEPLPLMKREESGQVPMKSKAATPQEMRVIEVNEALLPAYQKASTLELTDVEISALMAPFPDEAVEIRPHDGLIYLPHILISDRLNKVFSPGKWALVCRRHWLDGNTMYGEYVLLIRGCYVGESVGGHPYQPNNPKTNYSDTLESTAAEALRRIAGKRLSCGSQVWHPEYARNWVARYGHQVNGKWARKPTVVAPATKPQPPAPAKQEAPKPEAEVAKCPTEATRKWFMLQMAPLMGTNSGIVLEYFQKVGQLLPTEKLEDLPLRFLPASKEQLKLLFSAIAGFEAGDEAKAAFPPHQEQTKPPVNVARNEPEESFDDVEPNDGEPDEPWRRFPMPFGKSAGVALEDLSKNYLFGLWANYKVETEYNGKPKKPETIAKDTEFRKMLDQAGQHYQFEKKD